MCRRIAVTTVALIALAIIGAIWLMTRPIAAPPTAASARPASPARVHAVEERLRAALDMPSPAHPIPPLRTRSARSGGTTVRLSQDDLNTLLSGDPRIRKTLADAGVSGVQIALSAPDRAAAVAHVDYQGHTADVQAQGRLSVTEGGALVFTPSSLSVGLLPLPQSLADKVQGRIDAALRRVQQELPIRVERVTVEHEELVLRGSAKPV